MRLLWMAALVGGVAIVSGCAVGRPQIIMPDLFIGEVEWTPEELAKETTVRTLKVTQQASYHLLRTTKSELPHVHDHNDLTVVLLSGKGTMHLGDRAVTLRRGDVLLIPQGVVHWLELESSFGEAYLVSIPPRGENFRRMITGKDR